MSHGRRCGSSWGSLRHPRAVAALAIACFPKLAHAGGGKATPLQNVADTRDLSPGFVKFLADTYNANLWLFGVYVVVIMAVMGVILGLSADKLMSLTGISLGKTDHHE